MEPLTPPEVDSPPTEPTTGGSVDPRAASPSSILGGLKTAYDESLAQRTKLFELPWLRNLWAMMTPLDVADFEKARKVTVSVDENLSFTAEAIAKHCVEIYYGETERAAKPLAAIVAAETGQSLSSPIRFDRRFAEIFGLGDIGDRPRAVVLGLLTRTEDTLPFTAFAERVVLWSRQESGATVDEVLGE